MYGSKQIVLPFPFLLSCLFIKLECVNDDVDVDDDDDDYDDIADDVYAHEWINIQQTMSERVKGRVGEEN